MVGFGRGVRAGRVDFGVVVYVSRREFVSYIVVVEGEGRNSYRGGVKGRG